MNKVALATKFIPESDDDVDEVEESVLGGGYYEAATQFYPQGPGRALGRCLDGTTQFYPPGTDTGEALDDSETQAYPDEGTKVSDWCKDANCAEMQVSFIRYRYRPFVIN